MNTEKAAQPTKHALMVITLELTHYREATKQAQERYFQLKAELEAAKNKADNLAAAASYLEAFLLNIGVDPSVYMPF